jgi:DNA-binding Xre family transcriptional regulator
MLALVENTRRKQIAWIEAILAHRNWNQFRLAKEAGINHSTLSKFLADPDNIQQLSTRSVEKIAVVSGIPPYQTQPLQTLRGVAEQEAAPFVYTTNFDAMVERAVEAMKADRNGLDPWVLRSRALESAGYMPGDVLMVDLNAEPKNGDVVCAQVYDRQGRAETVMRLYEYPFLVAASLDRELMRPLLIDDERATVRGVVVAALKMRRAA